MRPSLRRGPLAFYPLRFSYGAYILCRVPDEEQAMDETITLTLDVKVPQRYAEAFLKGIAGDDGDILLAAEKAMREHVDTWPTGDAIEVAPGGDSDEWDERLAELRAAGEAERRELVTYGPRA